MAIVKCGHAGCTCLPGPGLNFCSTHCQAVQEAADLPEEIGCGCGHYGCDPRSVGTALDEDMVAQIAPGDVAVAE